MTYKILGSRFFTNSHGAICIVAVRTNTHEPDAVDEWKAYISSVPGYSMEYDEQIAATWGNQLSADEARGFFPHLDIERYKKD